MSRLAALKDLMPYLERFVFHKAPVVFKKYPFLCLIHSSFRNPIRLLKGLKRVLLDPIPEARETSAKALGKVLPSFGEDACPQVCLSLSPPSTHLCVSHYTLHKTLT